MKILKFSATWCGPCKMMKPVVEQIEKDLQITIHEVDVDKEPQEATKYDVRSVPTFIKVDDDGREIGRDMGALPYPKLVEFIKDV